MRIRRSIAILSALALAGVSLTGVAQAGQRTPIKATPPTAVYSTSTDFAWDLNTATGGGDIKLTIKVNATIAMIDINLPDGFTWVDADVAVGDSCSDSEPDVTLSGRTLTAKSFACTGDGTDSYLVTLTVTNAELATTLDPATLTEGDYLKVTSQFRTAPTRSKAASPTTWVTYGSMLHIVDSSIPG